MQEIIEVDPRILHVPTSRLSGADPYKYHQQVKKHGSTVAGMPPLEVTRGKDGELMINNGVTRATRVARLLPGQTVQAIVTDVRPRLSMNKMPTIGELLP